MLIGPKFVAIAYWHPLGVIHRCLWDTLGWCGALLFPGRYNFFQIFELLALRIFRQIFPGPSSEVLHTELRNFLHLQLRNFSISILRSVTKDLENFLNL